MAAAANRRQTPPVRAVGGENGNLTPTGPSAARRAAWARYRATHGELLRAKARKYQVEHRAQAKARDRAWREEHRDELRARRRASYAALRAAGLSRAEAQRHISLRAAAPD